MRKKNMKKKIIGIFVGLLLVSTTLVGAYISVPSGIRLPDVPVTLNTVDGTTTYFDITLSGVPAGNDVTNGLYPGWCADFSIAMPRNTNLLVTLYDSYGTLPARAQDSDWDKVNWILNNKDGYSMMDIQYAFWYLINEHAIPAGHPGAQTLVANAVDGFTYEPGDIIAIVAVPERTDVQCSFIELVIPQEQGGCTYTPGYWKNHAVGKHVDPTWGELPQGPDTVFYGNHYGLTWLSVMNFNAKQAKSLSLEWTDVEVYQHLAFHYVAAVLNGLNNGYLPSEIGTLISNAEQIFTNNHNLVLDSTETASAKQIASMLSDFNQGTLYDNWPHCED
jgi:hypothetical protein